MAELKTTRPYQERFLDGFDRSQLRQEVQKVKPRRFNKYVAWALGASLAAGSIGAPMKIVHDAKQHSGQREPETASAPISTATGINQEITGDLEAAQNIANQVAGGVAAAAKGVEQGVQQAVQAPLKIAAAAPAMIAQVPQQVASAAEDVRAQFFAKEVPFGSIIYNEAKKNNVRPELVAAIVQQESKFKPTARSSMGAQGLMQLVPKTGRWMGATNLMNPVQNIQAGAKYLKYLDERFNGNETNVIAAYNAGEGNVRRFGGIPPFRETRNYVSKVRNYQREFTDRMAGRASDAGVQTAEVR